VDEEVAKNNVVVNPILISLQMQEPLLQLLLKEEMLEQLLLDPTALFLLSMEVDPPVKLFLEDADHFQMGAMHLLVVKENANRSVRKVEERNAKPDVNLVNADVSASQKEAEDVVMMTMNKLII
jgi:hypothetical protein